MGLENAGFHPVFVSELNKDAMATYLRNRPDELVAAPENHVNDIFELTSDPERLACFGERMRTLHGDVGLVVGGPPCQGYSGIGHRRSFVLNKEEIPSNHLYREMAKVVQAVAPRGFLFENVRGLLNARWTPEGKKGEIWEDVQKAFRDIRVEHAGQELRYVTHAQLVFAKDYGVPQNRPRILMVGLREDVAKGVELDPTLPAHGLLPVGKGGAPSIEELFGDLVDESWAPGGETTSYGFEPLTEMQRALRTRRDGTIMAEGEAVTDQEYSNHSPHILAKFSYMLANDGRIPESMKTKKFAQRVMPRDWGTNGPTITATSLPDDYVHYVQPRTPTVREWARLQTFPDWYEFEGKRSTGGRRRAGDPSLGNWDRDVPKYTQIGNAVPVRLAEEVGKHLLKLIERDPEE